VELIVDEWLLEYMRPDAGQPERELASKFLTTWVERCDKVLIRRPSPFLSKFYRYMKDFGHDMRFKARFKKLSLLLFRNTDKTRIVDDEDVSPLPDEVETMVPRRDKYDRCLVEMALCSSQALIVTTDNRLKQALSADEHFRVYLLEQFLEEFAC
jgi:rRNA-processing protein FCF1